MSWAEIAQGVFALRGRSREDVTAVTTQEYAVGKEMAPRPTHSTLSLTKLTATGFEPTDQVEALREYVATLRDGRERPPQGSVTREGSRRPSDGSGPGDDRERPPQGSRPHQGSTTEGS